MKIDSGNLICMETFIEPNSLEHHLLCDEIIVPNDNSDTPLLRKVTSRQDDPILKQVFDKTKTILQGYADREK
jgi:hypothetical protein